MSFASSSRKELHGDLNFKLAPTVSSTVLATVSLYQFVPEEIERCKHGLEYKFLTHTFLSYRFISVLYTTEQSSHLSSSSAKLLTRGNPANQLFRKRLCQRGILQLRLDELEELELSLTTDSFTTIKVIRRRTGILKYSRVDNLPAFDFYKF